MAISKDHPNQGPPAGAARLRVAEADLPNTPWLTPQQAAAYLQISLATLHRLCRKRALRYHTLGFSRIRRFRAEELDRAMVCYL